MNYWVIWLTLPSLTLTCAILPYFILLQDYYLVSCLTCHLCLRVFIELSIVHPSPDGVVLDMGWGPASKYLRAQYPVAAAAAVTESLSADRPRISVTYVM